MLVLLRNLPASYLTVFIVVLGGFCDEKANGNYADPDNSHGYIACSNGFPHKIPCPANLKFNETKNRCEYNASYPPGC